MQKKIMLALIMSSSSIMVCQEAQAPQEAMQPQLAAETAQVNQAVPTEQQSINQNQAGAAVAPTPENSVQAPVAQTPDVEQPIQPAPQMPLEPPSAQEPGPIAPEQAGDEDLEIKGIDTVDINEAKGNWLYKRIWWERAERTYEKIKQLTDKILESRMNFFVKRNELDRMIVDFYSELGFRQGELNELIGFMSRQLEQERSEGTLDEKERELLALLNREKKNIEQVQQGNQNISKIDQALNDAIMKLVEQLNQAKYYEQQAWEHFKAINRELSDKKARELFYSMDTYWRNLNSINSYLSDAFAKYFDQLVQKVQQETDKIKVSVDALSEKGVNLQAQALSMKQECKAPVKEESDSQETESTGLLATLWRWIKAPFVAVGSLFGWIGGLFGGSSSQEEVALVKPASRAARDQSSTPEEPS